MPKLHIIQRFERVGSSLSSLTCPKFYNIPKKFIFLLVLKQLIPDHLHKFEPIDYAQLVQVEKLSELRVSFVQFLHQNHFFRVDSRVGLG